MLRPVTHHPLYPYLIMAYGHAFNLPDVPTQDEWDDVVGLKELIPVAKKVFYCSNGCGLAYLPTIRPWIDITGKSLIAEDARSPCPNQKDSGDSAAAASSAAPTPPARHARVGFTALMVKATSHPSFAPTPAVAINDEKYMASLSETAKVVVQQQHTSEPSALRDVRDRCVRQALTAVTAGLGVVFAAIQADDDFKNKEVATTSYIKAGVPDKSQIKVLDIVHGLFALMVTTRGIIERTDHIATVGYRLYKSVCVNGQWIRAMHEHLRADLAVFRDAIERPDRLYSPGQHLESTALAALGSAVVSQDASAMRAFYRAELPREESTAKKLGWKPSSSPSPSSASPAASAAGAAAASASAAILGGGITADGAGAQPSPVKGQQQKTGKQGGRPPRKRPRKQQGGKVDKTDK